MSKPKYKMTFLGSGSFFTTSNFHSNILIEDDYGHSLLIDCGSDIRWSLKKAGKELKDIEAVYISHLHADHAGGLEWLAYAKYFSDGEKPALICHTSLLPKISRQLESMMPTADGQLSLSDFFRIARCEGEFRWRDLEFVLIPVVHVPCEGNEVYSYGLAFGYDDGPTWYLSTDSAMNKDMLDDYKDVYEKSAVIFQDCETINTSAVHAHYDFLKKFPPQIKKKMHLYHYQDDPKQDALEDCFAGFVGRGEEFIYPGAE